jgi:hypothetical protein
MYMIIRTFILRNTIYGGIIATGRCCFAQLLKVVHSVLGAYGMPSKFLYDYFASVNTISADLHGSI